MIGLVVGLLVSLAAVSSLRIFGASQSQGTVTGGGLLSAVSAMGAIKNDVAAAGLGFFDGRLPLCTTSPRRTARTRLMLAALSEPQPASPASCQACSVEPPASEMPYSARKPITLRTSTAELPSSGCSSTRLLSITR